MGLLNKISLRITGLRVLWLKSVNDIAYADFSLC